MPGSPVAPSPVIPTYLPHKEGHLSHSIMPSVAVEEPQLNPLGAGPHQPPPCPAGASSRPIRSENISELVRFFQAPQGNRAAGQGQSKDTMNIIRYDGPMDLFKAGQRRLRQLGQTKPDKRIRGSGTESPVPSEKSASIRSNPDKERTKQQHLLALQREGLLPSTSRDDNDNSRPSRTKQDVEAIGRPWLDDSLPVTEHRRKNGSSASLDSLSHLRSESLGLGDLAALVEFSVSFPEYFDSDQPDPPPYQAQNPNPRHEASSERSSSSANAQPAIANGDNSNDRRQPSDLDNFPSPHRDPPAPTTPKPTLNQVAAPAGPSRASANANRPADGQRGGIRGAPSPGEDLDDDAKSLAVLLRATERLRREKKASQAGVPDPAPKPSPNPPPGPGDQPHSLNQGVTDTPLFVTAPEVQVKHDRAEEAAKKRQANLASQEDSHLHPPALAFPPQDKAVQPGLFPKNHSAGPIPLKLVAECLPSRASSRTGAAAVSKPSSPQLLLSSSSSSSSNNHKNSNADNSKTTSSSVHLQPPRPQVLLSPFPKQARRARSLTPDVAASGKERQKKKQKLSSPLYVVNAAAPLPPPNRPLPSVPQSVADVNDRHLVEREDDGNAAKMNTPAPDKPQARGTDSPTLGGAVHKPRLRRSIVGPRPSSRYSVKSNDPSEATYAASDEQSRKGGGSPGRRSLEALEEVRRGRADKVHALRLRDLGGKKDEQSATADSGKSVQQQQNSEARTPSTSESSSNAEKSKRDRRYHASAAPLFPLPSDPPPVIYDTPIDQTRRGSTSSLPGSTSTINGYGGGLSRSVSVTSGSIAGSSARQARARQPVKEPTRGLRHRRADSPSLPSSDDEGLRPPTRYSQARLDSVINEHHTQHARRPESLKSNNYTGLPHQQFDHHEPVTPHTPRSPPRSQPGLLHSRHSYVNHSQSIHYLEARVAMLERQNKMLQAALLAALGIGVSHDAESVRSGSASPALEATRIPTISERSMSSPIDNSQARKMSAQARYQPLSHHHSWASPRRQASQESRRSFESSSSRSDASMRAVENMLSDVEVGASGGS